MPTSSVADGRLLRDIMQKWCTQQGDIPRDYTGFDMETTGFMQNDDLIVELGSCLVENGKPQYYESHVLNWTLPEYEDVIPPDWLVYKLDRCATQMQRAGRVSHMTLTRMKKEGDDPRLILGQYAELLSKQQQGGGYIVGHNVLNFDKSRFEFSVGEWLGQEFELDSERIIDTAAIEKALQTGMEPCIDERMSDYFLRVLNRPAPGLHWSLEPWCVEKYQLIKKYPDLTLEDAHSAGFDALLVCLLMEEFRGIGDHHG